MSEDDNNPKAIAINSIAALAAVCAAEKAEFLAVLSTLDKFAASCSDPVAAAAEVAATRASFKKRELL